MVSVGGRYKAVKKPSATQRTPWVLILHGVWTSLPNLGFKVAGNRVSDPRHLLMLRGLVTPTHSGMAGCCEDTWLAPTCASPRSPTTLPRQAGPPRGADSDTAPLEP